MPLKVTTRFYDRLDALQTGLKKYESVWLERPRRTFEFSNKETDNKRKKKTSDVATYQHCQ